MTEQAAAPALPVPAALAPKSPEDMNLEVYESIFLKCMGAAARIITSRHGDTPTEESKTRQVKIAVAIFDRFYNDQNAMKQGKQQADAMLQGLTSVLEGGR
jgi:hypothetical protein